MKKKCESSNAAVNLIAVHNGALQILEDLLCSIVVDR